MGLIFLEALLALVLLVGIVWWTMFSGRTRGELEGHDSPDAPAPPDGSPTSGNGADSSAGDETPR